MSSSMRTRRMARNHRKLQQAPRLNLVALMDIFTILVLFLMVNNGDVEVLQSDRQITLPESVSEQKPQATLTIKISQTDILLQGRRIAYVEEALAQQENTVAQLAEALRDQAHRAPRLSPQEQQTGRPIVIMGDQDMPYALLKRVMATCAASDYRDVSLAVNSMPVAPADAALLAAVGVSR